MNNLKIIREIYGITQEDIAKAININRATISNWENSKTRQASNSSLEKLSLFYGIGPEYFYEKEIDEKIRMMLINNAKRQKEIEETNGQSSKTEMFSKIFSSITFDEAVEQYMISMKMMLATADSGTVNKLETALLINKKMGKRLESMLEIRRQEDKEEEVPLSELLDSLSKEN